MTTTVERPASAGAAVGRRPDRRHTTPGWLRTVTVALVGLAMAAGAAAVWCVSSRSHAVSTARATAEPLVVDAQTALVMLSDANTTVAGGFLSGPVIPAGTQARYQNDLAQASASLTAAAERAGTGAPVGSSLQRLDVDLPVYSGLVATAEADNRQQGHPLSAAYLAEANHFMTVGLLPAASALYSQERAGLTHDEQRATDPVPLRAVIVLLTLLLVGLAYLQVGLARRFRRLFNIGSLVATLATVSLAVWLAVALSTEGTAVSHAEHHGTEPLGALTQAHIQTSQARADDELTLVTRDADPTYQLDFDAVDAQLLQVVGRPEAGWSAAERQADAAAGSAWSSYLQDHRTVRTDDTTGDLTGAILFDQQTSAKDAAAADATLNAGVSAAVASFEGSTRAAQSDLAGLIWISVVLMTAVLIAVLAATRPRLREYR